MDQPVRPRRPPGRLALLLRLAPATVALGASWWLLAVLAWFWGAGRDDTVLLRMGAVTPGALGGQPWRLMAGAFLHANLLHIACNTLALRALGPGLEAFLGTPRFLVLYTAGALAAGGAGALAAVAEPGRSSVGASGALLALFGATTALVFHPRSPLPAPVRARARRRMAWNLALVTAISLLPGVDLAAHAGGFAAGFLLALAPGLRPDPWRRRSSRGLRRTAGAAVLLLAAGPLPALVAGRPWTPPPFPALAPRKLPDAGVTLALPAGLALRTLDPGRAWLAASADGLVLAELRRIPTRPGEARLALGVLDAGRDDPEGRVREIHVGARPGRLRAGPPVRGRRQESWFLALDDAVLRLDLIRPAAPGWDALGRRILAPLAGE